MAMLNTLDNLPEDPAELRQVSELLAAEVKALTFKVEQLQHQLHGANRHRFGSTSESMDQLQLFVENEEIAKASVDVVATAPAEPAEPKEKPRRQPLPDHLDRIEQILSVGEDCPECGGDLSKLGEDATEELEYIPGRFVVNKIFRPRMACRRCETISQIPDASVIYCAFCRKDAGGNTTTGICPLTTCAITNNHQISSRARPCLHQPAKPGKVVARKGMWPNRQ